MNHELSDIQAGFRKDILIFKLDLEKIEEPEIGLGHSKLLCVAGRLDQMRIE